MKFAIREVRSDSAYIVVTLDDGSAFGQIVRPDGGTAEEMMADIERRIVRDGSTRLARSDLRQILTQFKDQEIVIRGKP